MKASELKELNPQEIENKIVEMKETLFNLRFQNEIGQLENPSKMKETRRTIARAKTILNQKTEPTDVA